MPSHRHDQRRLALARLLGGQSPEQLDRHTGEVFSCESHQLLTTFEQELGGVALVPGSGGIFEVRVEGTTVWSRKEWERFPEMKELKQLVRDRVAPEKDLGHSDR